MGKDKLLSAISNIEKRFGANTLQKMGNNKKLDIKTYSSGSLLLNRALGGGFARGKIIEIYGDEALGKSGRALEAAREVQQSGGVVAYIDSEHALNVEFARNIGVKVDDIWISQPSCGEEAIEIARALAESGEVRLIIFDSVSAMTPRAELEGESGESKMGLMGRMMSQALRQLTASSSANDCTLIFINQQREKIGGYYPSKVGSGGNALKFYAYQRIELKKEHITENEVRVGFIQKNKVTKNKLCPPFKVANIKIFYDTGADKIGELIDLAVEFKIIFKKSSWYSYKDSNIGQGLEKAKNCLNNNSDLYKEIQKKVLKNLEG